MNIIINTLFFFNNHIFDIFKDFLRIAPST